VVVAFVAGRTSVGIDAGDWVGESTVGSARAVLSTVAAATIRFASGTFSISLLIVQQASSQFSPRLVQALTRDPFNRRVVALVLRRSRTAWSRCSGYAGHSARTARR